MRSVLNRGPPPYRRPPSEPPPPPLPLSKPPLLSTCTSSPPDIVDVEAQEDYEIPICGNAPPTFFQKSPTLHDQIKTTVGNYVPQPTAIRLSPDTRAIQDIENREDTYEAIEKAEEENYEVVAENQWSGSSSSLASSSSDRPVLPPRSQALSYGPPPPLPEKPRKYQDILVPHVNSNQDPLADVERPKLPRSKETFSSKASEDQSQASSSQSVTGAITGLLSSVLSSRSIREGKKPARDQCNSSGGDTASTTGSHSSRASTPEKSDPMSSLTGPINNAPQLPDKKITPPINFPKYSPQVSFEDIGTNVANRPLPPVPATSKLYEDPKKEKDLIHQYSWFHDVERDTAEQLLQQQDGDGVYLVRQSRRAGHANPYTLTILFSNRIFHLNLRQRPDGLFALGREKPREKTFSTVAELISYHQKEPILLTARGEPAGKTCLNVTLGKS
ncbi:B-cell linker protein-like isoform X2 [Limulus polyphemus]|uniref:B-cell linker protein-like isoform X2 n=1 Tax=Limulus polyphemus TaxID=6850 RepID=A0ABM1SME4_LIMPO|nr:B-cell linker protein-like isoform X2 [Limulus polyphemus]